jgi:flagellar motor switch protein FliN
VHQALRLDRGAIIELDASEDDHVQILANNKRWRAAWWWSAGSRIAVEVKEMLAGASDKC